MATVLMLLTFLLTMEAFVVRATGQCSSSADISMSSSFLPAALSAIAPLGYGSCNGDNSTCTTPPVACPSSSCCINARDPNGGTCGCLTSSPGETQTCSDPKTLAVSLTGCNADGRQYQSNLQLSFFSSGTECVESVEVNKVPSSNGSTILHFTATTCVYKRSEHKSGLGPAFIQMITDIAVLLLGPPN